MGGLGDGGLIARFALDGLVGFILFTGSFLKSFSASSSADIRGAAGRGVGLVSSGAIRWAAIGFGVVGRAGRATQQVMTTEEQRKGHGVSSKCFGDVPDALLSTLGSPAQ